MSVAVPKSKTAQLWELPTDRVIQSSLAKTRALLRGLEVDRLPEESFLRLPLLRHALLDPCLQLHRRLVDCRWHYTRTVSTKVTGFNPFRSTFYYGHDSVFARWLRDPVASGRHLNTDDHLVGELLFFVHDYLHIWCYALARSLHPELGIGSAPITTRNFEDFVFVHLATEAAATVGLDYWYLSCRDLNDVVPVGTTSGALTVSYLEKDLLEYRRFNPNFQVQAPQFYDFIGKFYCDGELTGFSTEDLDRSPKLLKWLRHELEYGEQQRIYIRNWLSRMSEGRVTLKEGEAARPCAVTKPWQKQFLREVGRRLWDKVKEDRLEKLPALHPSAVKWTSQGQALDFRYVNLNRVGSLAEQVKRGRWTAGGKDYTFFFCQFLSRYRMPGDQPVLLKWLRVAYERKDPDMLIYLMKDQEKLAGNAEREPWDLLILN